MAVTVDTKLTVVEVTRVVVDGAVFLAACDVVDVDVTLKDAEVVPLLADAVRTAKILP